jgi:hypothetical protein
VRLAALSLLHALADLGEVRIRAVTHGTGLDAGVGAAEVINRFYGRGGNASEPIPVGRYTGPIGDPLAVLNMTTHFAHHRINPYKFANGGKGVRVAVGSSAHLRAVHEDVACWASEPPPGGVELAQCSLRAPCQYRVPHLLISLSYAPLCSPVLFALLARSSHACSGTRRTWCSAFGRRRPRRRLERRSGPRRSI